jgi:hypothetical protein
MRRQALRRATGGQSRKGHKPGPWLGVIDAILEDDETQAKKQRHTAKRIFERAVARIFIDARTTAAASVVMSTASVAARMSASPRVPAAEILPATEALRCVPAAKQVEAARMRRLVGRPPQSPCAQRPQKTTKSARRALRGVPTQGGEVSRVINLLG